jgi:hypothetical protein
MSSGRTVVCYGICQGRPGYIDPKTGLSCMLCFGSGKVTVYSARELQEDAWAEVRRRKLMPLRVVARFLANGSARLSHTVRPMTRVPPPMSREELALMEADIQRLKRAVRR